MDGNFEFESGAAQATTRFSAYDIGTPTTKPIEFAVPLVAQEIRLGPITLRGRIRNGEPEVYIVRTEP